MEEKYKRVIERDRRDRETTARHAERVAAGEQLILKRSMEGELVSYRPEEYGFLKSGSGAQVTTVWGMGILTAVMVVFALGSTFFLIRGYIVGADVPWGGWFVPLLSGSFVPLGVHYTRQEWRARALRRERGIARPGS